MYVPVRLYLIRLCNSTNIEVINRRKSCFEIQMTLLAYMSLIYYDNEIVLLTK